MSPEPENVTHTGWLPACRLLLLLLLLLLLVVVVVVVVVGVRVPMLRRPRRSSEEGGEQPHLLSLRKGDDEDIAEVVFGFLLYAVQLYSLSCCCTS